MTELEELFRGIIEINNEFIRNSINKISDFVENDKIDELLMHCTALLENEGQLRNNVEKVEEIYEDSKKIDDSYKYSYMFRYRISLSVAISALLRFAYSVIESDFRDEMQERYNSLVEQYKNIEEYETM